jgi:hypothetical protein
VAQLGRGEVADLVVVIDVRGPDNGEPGRRTGAVVRRQTEVASVDALVTVGLDEVEDDGIFLFEGQIAVFVDEAELCRQRDEAGQRQEVVGGCNAGERRLQVRGQVDVARLGEPILIGVEENDVSLVVRGVAVEVPRIEVLVLEQPGNEGAEVVGVE